MSGVRRASTVVLVRPSEAGFEILMLKRHARSGFMANAYVFPGGRLDDEDGAAAWVRRLKGLDPEDLATRMEGLSGAADVIAHLVATVRETFEESGLLLALREDGGPLPEAAVISDWRSRVHNQEVSFLRFVETHDLTLDVGALRYFAHWVTPSAEPRRYDTRFFLTVAPAAQEGKHDGRETTDSRWVTPAEALEQHEKGAMMLAPPTWTILGQLAALSSVDEVVSWASSVQVERIQPTISEDDGCLVIALPGDPLHEGGPTEGTAQRRVVLRDGRWRRS